MITTATLRDLIDGKVIEVNTHYIVILKDDRKFQIGMGTPIVKEIKKQQ